MEDVLELQRRIQQVVDQAAPATVCLQAGRGSGSGVIVSEDGLVLTAGHVVVRPGQPITFLFPDGTTAQGESLGVNEGMDSGLAKITDPGPWPYVEMGSLDAIQRGDWVVALGHPGGFDAGRPVVARMGRVLNHWGTAVQSGCTIIGGDSGGPLLDLEGRVIGVHSRIGQSLRQNFHIPITVYHDTWDRLVAGEVWNRLAPSRPLRAGDPYIGVRPSRRGGSVVAQVLEGQAAHRAGVRAGDQVTAINGARVESFGDIVYEIRQHKAGDAVTLTVDRDGALMDFELTLGSFQPDPAE